MKRCRSAFTLIEILVVVCILGVVSAVIIPQLGTRNDILAAAAARQIMSDLTFAQNQAITSQTPVYVVFTKATGTNTPGGSYSVMTALPSTVMTHPISKRPWTVTFGTGNSGVITAFKTVRLATASFDTKAAIMFDETGSPWSIPATGGSATSLSAGSVGISCSGFNLTITVEPLTGTLTVK